MAIPPKVRFESRRQSAEEDSRCKEARLGQWRGDISAVQRRQKEDAEADNREEGAAGSGRGTGGCGRKAAASVLREMGVAAGVGEVGGGAAGYEYALTTGGPVPHASGA